MQTWQQTLRKYMFVLKKYKSGKRGFFLYKIDATFVGADTTQSLLMNLSYDVFFHYFNQFVSSTYIGVLN